MPRSSKSKTPRARSGARPSPSTAPGFWSEEFLSALSVIALTLAAGLIAMWLTGDAITKFGKGEVQIPAGTGDIYECNLAGSGQTWATTGTSRNTAGQTTQHWYRFETYYAPCTSADRTSCTDAWGSIYENTSVGNPISLPWTAVSALGPGYWRLGSKMTMIDTTPVNYRCNDNAATDPVVQVAGSSTWSITSFEGVPVPPETAQDIFINGGGLTPNLHLRAGKQLRLVMVVDKAASATLEYDVVPNPVECGGAVTDFQSANATNSEDFTPGYDGLCDWNVTVTDTTGGTKQRSVTKLIDPWIQQPAAGQTINDIGNINVTVHDNGTVNEVRACLESATECRPGMSGSGYVGQGFRTSGTTFSVHFNFFQNGVTCPTGQTSCQKAIKFEALRSDNGLTGWGTSQTFTIVPQASTQGTWGYQTSIGAGPSGQTCINDDTNPQHISALSDMDYGVFTVTATCSGNSVSDCMPHGVVNAQVLMTDTLQQNPSWALQNTQMTQTVSGKTVTYTINPNVALSAFEVARRNPEKEWVIRYNAYSVNDHDPATGDQLFMKQHSCTVVRKISSTFSRVNVGTPSAQGTCSLTMEARDTGDLLIENAAAMTGRLVPAATGDIVPVTPITGLTISPTSPFTFGATGTQAFTVRDTTTTPRSVKFFGFASSNGTEVRFFDTETLAFPTACLAGGTGVPRDPTPADAITVTAGNCNTTTTTSRDGTVVVTVMDKQTTPAAITNATVELRAYATTTSTTPLPDVTIRPPATNAAGAAGTITGNNTAGAGLNGAYNFTVTVPAADARAVVFRATIKTAGNPDVVYIGGSSNFPRCGGGGCTPTTCSVTTPQCGTVTGTDNCGGTCTRTGGTCTAPQTCNNNTCSCTPTTCSVTTPQCGTVTGTDNCGGTCTRTGGTCPTGQTCTNNTCQPTNCTLTPSIAITPATATVQPGGTAPFTVTAANVTWTLSTGGVGTVAPATGTATTSAPTTVTYTAPATGTTPRTVTLTLSGTATGQNCQNPTAVTATVTIGATPVCGNGTIDTGEQCDDSNTTANDGCSAICQLEAPRNVACSSITQTSFRGTWTTPHNGAANFRLTLQNGSTTVSDATVPSTTNFRDYTNLTSNTTYRFGVRAVSAASVEGPEASVTCATTGPEIPSITLTPDPAAIPADGQSISTLTCQLNNYPNNPATGTLAGYTVTFAKIRGGGALLTTSGTTTIGVDDDGNPVGLATAQVQAPTASGDGEFECTEPTHAGLRGTTPVIYNPTDPTSFSVALTVPLEGRQSTTGGPHGTYKTKSLEVTISAPGPFAEIVRTDVETSDTGLASFSVPNLTLADGRQLVVSVKTNQHLRRTVIGTVQGNTLVLNLGNPKTFIEPDGNLMKGKYFLPAGDLTGTSADEDLNDNLADASDIATWIANFRKQSSCTTPGTFSDLPADLDGNCHAGAEDLSLIVRNFMSSGDDKAGLFKDPGSGSVSFVEGKFFCPPSVYPSANATITCGFRFTGDVQLVSTLQLQAASTNGQDPLMQPLTVASQCTDKTDPNDPPLGKSCYIQSAPSTFSLANRASQTLQVSAVALAGDGTVLARSAVAPIAVVAQSASLLRITGITCGGATGARSCAVAYTGTAEANTSFMVAGVVTGAWLRDSIIGGVQLSTCTASPCTVPVTIPAASGATLTQAYAVYATTTTILDRSANGAL